MCNVGPMLTLHRPHNESDLSGSQTLSLLLHHSVHSVDLCCFSFSIFIFNSEGASTSPAQARIARECWRIVYIFSPSPASPASPPTPSPTLLSRSCFLPGLLSLYRVRYEALKRKKIFYVVSRNLEFVGIWMLPMFAVPSPT